MTGFMRAGGHHPVRYWLSDETGEQRNFGDYLTELLLDQLFALPSYPADAYHLIGSVITESQIRHDMKVLDIPTDTGLVAFWCCGMRENKPLSAWAMEHARFFGVRGPLSRDVLGLPPETALGDPGLLAALLHPAPRLPNKETICIVHVLDPKPDGDILKETGANRVVRASVASNKTSLCEFMEMIAGATFVLSGALHGAIVACAYNVPFAYFDSGYIDTPFKWEDFAASVNLPCIFVKTISEGRALYQEELEFAYKPLPLVPLLSVAPFAVRHAMVLKALQHDGHLSASMLHSLLVSLEVQGIDHPQTIVAAQKAWLERIELGKSRMR